MLYDLDDDALFRIFTHSKFLGTKRFILSLLQIRGSRLIESNYAAFMSDNFTNVQFMRALGDHKKVIDGTSKIFPSDLPFIMDSAKKVGLFNETFFNYLCQKFSETQDLWLVATLYKASKALDLQGSPGTILPTPSQNTSEKRPLTIVGITKISRAGPSLTNLISHLQNFCDFIIVSIPENYKDRAASENPEENVYFLNQAEPYDDGKIYQSLLERGRTLDATHFLHIDDDERLSSSITKEFLSECCLSTQPGDVITVPWAQAHGSDAERFIDFDQLNKFSNYRNEEPYKDLIFHDNGFNHSSSSSFHSHWCPISPKSKRLFLDQPLIHFEGLELFNLLNKYNRYLYWDFSINKSFEIVSERYLPLLFRNLILVDKDRRENLLKDAGIHRYKNIYTEIEGCFCREGIDDFRLKFPINSGTNAKLIEDIHGPVIDLAA